MTRPALPIVPMEPHELFEVPLDIEHLVDDLVRSDFDASDFDARR